MELEFLKREVQVCLESCSVYEISSITVKQSENGILGGQWYCAKRKFNGT